MICHASAQQAAVAAVIFEKKMSHLELSTSEWSVVEQLKDTLKPFKMATQALSTDAYPTASVVLPKYLCVPGTSVRSERVFLSAGNIVNKKRAALDPDHVDRLVFLANNIRN